MKKGVKAIALILGAVFLISAGFIIANLTPEKKDFDDYKNDPAESSKPSLISRPEYPINKIDFKKLKSENEDIIGWIEIPDTVIDYPILYSDTDKDGKDYYIDRDMYKKKKSAGSIFVQTVNFSNFSDRNTVIYGHNMLNGTMFGTLKKYRDRKYFDEHDEIRVYIPGRMLTYKVYSAFVYTDKHLFSDFDFGNDKGYQEFIDMTYNPKSSVKHINKDVKVTAEDRIITLSTCTAKDEERYLVVAVLQNEVYTQ